MSYTFDVVPPSSRSDTVLTATGIDLPSAVASMFERLSRQPRDQALAGVDLALAFEVVDVGRWWVRIQDGGLVVSQTQQRADATVIIGPVDLLALSRGDLGLFSAYLQGRIAIRGDAALGLYLRYCFPLESSTGEAEP